MLLQDPFNQLLGNYLDKAEKAKNGTNGADVSCVIGKYENCDKWWLYVWSQSTMAQARKLVGTLTLTIILNIF